MFYTDFGRVKQPKLEVPRFDTADRVSILAVSASDLDCLKLAKQVNSLLRISLGTLSYSGVSGEATIGEINPPEILLTSQYYRIDLLKRESSIKHP